MWRPGHGKVGRTEFPPNPPSSCPVFDAQERQTISRGHPCYSAVAPRQPHLLCALAGACRSRALLLYRGSAPGLPGWVPQHRSRGSRGGGGALDQRIRWHSK